MQSCGDSRQISPIKLCGVDEVFVKGGICQAAESAQDSTRRIPGCHQGCMGPCCGLSLEDMGESPGHSSYTSISIFILI